MNITIGHVIAYVLDAQFRFNGEYPGPHRDIGKNINTINKILVEIEHSKPVHEGGATPYDICESDIEECEDGHPRTTEEGDN